MRLDVKVRLPGNRKDAMESGKYTFSGGTERGIEHRNKGNPEADACTETIVCSLGAGEGH